MAFDLNRDPDFEWLDMLQPTGLVVAKNLLRDLGLVPERQTQIQSAEVASLIQEDLQQPAIPDAFAFVQAILGWDCAYVAGGPGGPELPPELTCSLPEHDTVLAPHWAVKELGDAGPRWQLLVRIEGHGIDPDKRASLGGWEATPHQRLERLLRETGVYAGLLISDQQIRLLYAPKGETSGWVNFPIRPLASVPGRSMLAGLKLLLGAAPLFTNNSDRRLPSLLAKSREAQASVSTALAGQVLGALHELLRGLDAADPARIRNLASERSVHLYEGLLTVLLRLVFVLYAEDRDLLPSLTDAQARELYDRNYSVRGLYGKLVDDAALNPDTMDERRGAWGQLLSLFRLIQSGHRSGFVQARGGKLFDPDVFSFLEGRDGVGDPPRVMTVSDGCVLRVLEGLMTLAGAAGAGRERLSYRTLDVEQIGSVYETVMGFTVQVAAGPVLAIKAGKNNRTPVFVDLDALLARKVKERIKYLKEDVGRVQLAAKQSEAIEKARSYSDLAAALDSIVDERASPMKRVGAAGVPILQPTDERRRTGSHYTPRSLTEPIVRYALEPAFDRLGTDARPEQVLELKVCDPAMGSGAFLVEATRAIATRLVQAWTRWPQSRPNIPLDEDDDLHARRLVAQRCIYGVDKNPLAADLAKLSLWLATLARDHEFTFLDHALKCGDSLVGLTSDQIAAAHWDDARAGLTLFRQLVRDSVVKAMNGRAEIQNAPDDTTRVIQEARHRSLETDVAPIRMMGDAVIAAFFAADKPKAREKARAEVESNIAGFTTRWDRLEAAAASLRTSEHPITPFHWQVEFPEVFARENGGFDAIVGNPPFVGGTQSTEASGEIYATWLTQGFGVSTRRINIVAYFFLRAFRILRSGGAFGLVSTNKIAQGDTREQSLLHIVQHDGTIYRAVRRMRWPGEADVVISIIHAVRKNRSVSCVLDGKPVSRISAYLSDIELDESPFRLSENVGKSFMGTKITGVGFTFDDKEAAKGNSASVQTMREILLSDARARDVIFPFVGAEEVNNTPDHAFRRYVIDLNGHSEERARSQWPRLLEIIEKYVKPGREKLLSKGGWSAEIGRNWWLLAQRADKLEKMKRDLPKVIVTASSAVMHHLFAYVDSTSVFSHKLIVIASSELALLGVLQSRVHELWSRTFGTTFGSSDALTYSVGRVYATFPFPQLKTLQNRPECSAYLTGRAQILQRNGVGLTRIYGEFHEKSCQDKDILELRNLHHELDCTVLEAYGWHDLAAQAKSCFLDDSNEVDQTYQDRLFWSSEFRDEVLARLLALNAERHADELRLGITAGDETDDEVADEEDQS